MKTKLEIYRANKAWNKKMLALSGFIAVLVGGFFNYALPNGDGVWTGFNGGVVSVAVMLGLYFGILRRPL